MAWRGVAGVLTGRVFNCVFVLLPHVIVFRVKFLFTGHREQQETTGQGHPEELTGDWTN